MTKNIEVKHPEWLKDACDDTIRTLQLIADGTLPKSLIGTFIETSALRMLRCVHGTDAASVEALQRRHAASVELSQFVEIASGTDLCGEQFQGEGNHVHTCIGSFADHIEAAAPVHQCLCGSVWK